MATRFVLYVTPTSVDTNSGSNANNGPIVSGTQATWDNSDTTIQLEASDLSGVTANVDTINLSGAENPNSRDIYHITSVDDVNNIVTVAETLTSASTGNCAWAIGGALLTPTKAFAALNAVSGTLYDHLYIQGGTTYQAAAATASPIWAFSLSGGRDQLTFVEGYTTTTGDGGFAVLDGSNNSGTNITVLSVTALRAIVRNIKVTGSKGTGNAISLATNTNNSFEKCWATDQVAGSAADLWTSTVAAFLLNCRANGVLNNGNGFTLGNASQAFGCISHDNVGSTADGISCNGNVSIVFCILDTNGAAGALTGNSSNISIINTTTYANADSGVKLADNASQLGNAVVGCIHDTNTGYGINRVGVTAGFPLKFEAYNNFNGNTIDTRNNAVDTTAYDTTATDYTGSCLTAPATQDFTVGTGAKAKAFPGALQVGGTGYLDGGALQRVEPAGGSGRPEIRGANL